ncbi:lipopolysaccharide biosynthesis protein [Sphingomonas lacunae]|uniref:Lipopolysaccharide biosynthesis protein n=1 Tax=Sphingomonas lacunae TaxID=2698828 RepID=A0A6M4AYW8_9SPHN|nr:lipopolysaccharide biosynthesis protein [Sphingomonas lacunae]
MAPASAPPAASEEVEALAKGGRTSVFGFILRLVARLPFLYFAGRWYGPEALGRFAYAVLVVEFAAQLATLGLKRGLAQQLSATTNTDDHANIVWDAMLVTLLASVVLAALLIAVPQVMFPNSGINQFDRLLPLIIIAIAGTDIALAALAYRYNIGATVWARAIVEPWAISIAAFAFAFYSLRDGLILSYVVAMLAAWVTALVPLFRSYGLPRAWDLHPLRLVTLARDNLPLAGADAIEWGSRRLDLAVLGLFASPTVVGIYYVAQQVASLPQKLKSSFDPILGPVISRGVAENRLKDVAAQVAQVGFWVLAAQTGVALALGIPAEAVMGLAGPGFVAGAGALALLLAAEVVASTAVTSEAALVYLAPRRNLIYSLAMITLQGALSVALCYAIAVGDIPEIWHAVAVAGALVIALATASVIKAHSLARLCDAPVHGWRAALFFAAGGAMLLGYGATQLPEWAELILGVPIILGIYGWIIWTRGFGPADRALLKSGKKG